MCFYTLFKRKHFLTILMPPFTIHHSPNDISLISISASVKG